MVKFVVVLVVVDDDDPEGVPNVVRGVVPKVDPGVPSLLCGILEGVVSSLLTSDIVEPWRDPARLVGREVLGVRLDRIGIDVLDVVDSVLDGVRRPSSESAVEAVRDLVDRS